LLQGKGVTNIRLHRTDDIVLAVNTEGYTCLADLDLWQLEKSVLVELLKDSKRKYRAVFFPLRGEEKSTDVEDIFQFITHYSKGFFNKVRNCHRNDFILTFITCKKCGKVTLMNYCHEEGHFRGGPVFDEQLTLMINACYFHSADEKLDESNTRPNIDPFVTDLLAQRYGEKRPLLFQK
jgi:hypothetical protein